MADMAALTTYTVGGMPRSGTSMMMRALAAGGLDPYFDPLKDAALAASWAHQSGGGYDPNPNGCLEPGALKGSPEFPVLIRGRLVKLMGGGAGDPRFRASGPMRVAFIVRDREAVLRSHQRAFGRVPPWLATDEAYRHHIESRIAVQRHARWVQDVVRFDYAEVVADPLGQFCRLAELGWPIDPYTAAVTVDPALNRNQEPGPVYAGGRQGDG